MKKWVVEDWAFVLTAIEGKAGNCRLGLEKGDKFTFTYECPEGLFYLHENNLSVTYENPQISYQL